MIDPDKFYDSIRRPNEPAVYLVREIISNDYRVRKLLVLFSDPLPEISKMFSIALDAEGIPALGEEHPLKPACRVSDKSMNQPAGRTIEVEVRYRIDNTNLASPR